MDSLDCDIVSLLDYASLHSFIFDVTPVAKDVDEVETKDGDIDEKKVLVKSIDKKNAYAGKRKGRKRKTRDWLQELRDKNEAQSKRKRLFFTFKKKHNSK
eukprot:372351_1